MTAAGYVLFQLGDRRFITRLDDVREIVRLVGLERLPGTRPPFAGVIALRGTPLPVLDVREQPDDSSGDVLVVAMDGDVVGIAVDSVVAVLAPDELTDGPVPARTLPSYIVDVRRHRDVPVLVVDLRLLLDVTAPAWSDPQGAAVGQT